MGSDLTLLPACGYSDPIESLSRVPDHLAIPNPPFFTNWKNGEMALRWAAAAFTETEKICGRILG